MSQREYTIERQLRMAKGISEAAFGSQEADEDAPVVSGSSGQILKEIRALRDEVSSLASRFGTPVGTMGEESSLDAPPPADALPTLDTEDGGGTNLTEENEFLRREIARMVRSMAQAKEQIAAIKHPEFDDGQVNAASSELAAIVNTTEKATNTILEMGEGVQETAERLLSIMGNDEDVQSACGDIIGRMNQMYEACNFQDITGQRVSKVVHTLEFIEERLRIIINVWGTEAFADIPIPNKGQLHETDELVTGPDSDDTGLSQDEIDSLFG